MDCITTDFTGLGFWIFFTVLIILWYLDEKDEMKKELKEFKLKYKTRGKK